MAPKTKVAMVSNPEVPAERSVSPFDRISEDLQRLRLDAGDVPYAEIVRRISRYRISQGVEPNASRPARSTVYDAFRIGRTRLNIELVSEIVRSLGGTEAEINAWRERCLQARRDQPTASPQLADRSKPEVSETRAGRSLTENSSDAQSQEPKKASWFWRRLLLMVSCIAVNLLGFWLVATLGIPLYLDMLGTAIVAMLLGPWPGVVVAVLTNVLGSSITDSSSLAFISVNVTGALCWGYGMKWVRRKGTLRRYYLLTLQVALACSLVATLVLVFVFQGGTGHASEITRANLDAFGMPLIVTVFESNLLYSLADKLLTGFLALAVMDRVRNCIGGSSYPALEQDISRRIKGEGLSG